MLNFKIQIYVQGYYIITNKQSYEKIILKMGVLIMEFENTVDKLETLSVKELIRLYVKTSGYDSFDKELIDLVKIEHEFLFGKVSIEYLDNAQIDKLNKDVGEIILYKLSEQYKGDD